MRKIFIALLLVCLFPLSATAEEEIYNAADGLSPRGQAQIQSVMPDFDFRSAVQSLSENSDAGFLHRLWNGLVSFFFQEAGTSLSVPLTAAAVAVLCSLLGRLGGDGSTSEMAFLITYAASIGLAIAAVGDAAELARGFSQDMAAFTNSVMPSLAVLSVGTGGGAAAVHPLLLAASSASSLLLSRIGIPSLYVSLSLSVISGLSSHTVLRKLSALIRKCAFFVVTGSLTVFGAVISVTGYAAGTLGGVAAKGIKFAVGSLVPVLGGILSESAEAVSFSALTVKNAAGGAGMLLILLLTLYPVIKTILHSFAYRLAAALSSTAADTRISSAFSDMADMLSALSGMTAAAGMLSMLSVGMLLRIGDMGVMLR
ncbi:MAG: hypothetical protein IJN74_07590 [Clostridia bacterium]|nr:hypothetical protein [Clostridia bacterium]